MISFRVILLFSLFLFYTNSYCQIDSHKLDSLSRAIDSSAKSHRKWQDSFNKVQDSLYQTSVADKDSHQFSSYKKEEQKKRKQSLVRLIIGVLFCIGLITGFMVRKKPKS